MAERQCAPPVVRGGGSEEEARDRLSVVREELERKCGGKVRCVVCFAEDIEVVAGMGKCERETDRRRVDTLRLS